MIQLDVTGDLKQVERHLNKLQRSAVPKAANRALNRIVGPTKTKAASSITKQTAFKSKEVRDHLIVRRSNWRTLKASITAERYSPNLIHYGAIKAGRGVKAKPYRKRRVFKGAFIANQGRTVFKRTSPRRLPIKKVYGPSVRAEFKRDDIRRIYATKAAQRWRPEFYQALNYFISKI